MMKRFTVLFLACLFLCGCTSQASAPESAGSSVQSTLTVSSGSASGGLYDPDSALEVQYQGALRSYPLNIPDVYGMRAIGDGLLIFSGTEITTLTLLTGEALSVTAVLSLDFFLEAEDPSLQTGGGGLSYYDPLNRQTVVLDASLKAVSHIAAPEDLSGVPILSADRNTLYYCTANAIRAWDLETGIRRCVKEIAYSEQAITGLYSEDTVLQCTIQDNGKERTMLLSAQNGLLLYERDGALTLRTSGSRYYLSFQTGMVQAMLFGEDAQSPQALTPADLTAAGTFLESQDAVVTVSSPGENTVQLDYYLLDTGVRRSTVSLQTQYLPIAVEDTSGGDLFVLIYSDSYGCQTLYRWDVSDSSTLLIQDSTDYTGTYYTAESPDWAGIARCQAYAAQIGSKYGLEVLIWEDALAVQPWDYDFEAEYLVPVLEAELEALDQRLSQYPDGMLMATISHFTGLKICILRQLTGTAESGSLDTATGLQFMDGTDACIALAAGEFSEQALYHELFHVMETHILNESTAFDQWEALNPSGFSYDYDYRANAQRSSGIYLEGENRAFIDTYSMSFPKEDRARIMEYAMLSGKEALFQSETMQSKLLALCKGIREAYALEKSEETFLWEQYLTKSLAYTQ